MRRKVIAISGGFDPLHIGHLRLIKAAKALSGELVIILNNDNWLRKKKGYAFMPQRERVAVLGAIRYVDRVMLTAHPKNPKDVSVCRELQKLNPDVFANGGDRKPGNIPEYELCKRLGVKMVFNVGGGKAQSSSALVRRAKNLHQK